MKGIWSVIRQAGDDHCVVTLIGSFPGFESSKPFMVHERHPIIEQMLRKGLGVTLVLCDPLYKTNKSPIIEGAPRDHFDSGNDLSRYVVIYTYMDKVTLVEKTIDVIIFPRMVGDDDIIKFDEEIRQNNWLHYIQYFTGLDTGTNIFPVDAEKRRFVANGGCMIDWQSGVSSGRYAIETGKMTKYAYALPPIVGGNRFMTMPLDMDQLVANLQKCPKMGFPKHDYSIGCIKLMLFYMFSDDLPFNCFMRYLKGKHEITARSPFGKPAEKQCMTFDKKSGLVGASIFTILYRSSMVVEVDDITFKIHFLPEDNVNTFLTSFVELIAPTKPVFYQKIVIDILLEWCKAQTDKTFNQFWFDKMNNFILFLQKMMRIKVDVKFDAATMSVPEINKQMMQVYYHICKAYC